ncbi:MAG: hypothetical protein PWQ08_220 [Clostridiales bacterium]|jgi:hypothetical protein|nr:hypothetical protein [Clostridiales bacterium]
MANEILLEKLPALIQGYLTEVEQQAAKRGPTDGLLGFGDALRNDGCHDRFADALQALVEQMVSAPVSATQAAVALRYLCEAPLQCPDNTPQTACARWMLEAAQTLALPLVPLLQPVDAAQLFQWYRSVYPRSRQLPAEKKLARALRQQAGK